MLCPLQVRTTKARIVGLRNSDYLALKSPAGQLCMHCVFVPIGRMSIRIRMFTAPNDLQPHHPVQPGAAQPGAFQPDVDAIGLVGSEQGVPAGEQGVPAGEEGALEIDIDDVDLHVAYPHVDDSDPATADASTASADASATADASNNTSPVDHDLSETVNGLARCCGAGMLNS